MRTRAERPARGWPRLDRIPDWIAAGALVVLVVFAYAPSLENGFIWDDDDYVQNNRTLQSGAGLRDIWLRLGATSQYYPLVHTSFWIEYQLWGLDPTGYHATNLALQAASSVLLWRLLSRLALPGGWLAAAIFAVHPVHVESVAWVTERKNVLSLVFALASLLVYLRASPPDAPPGTRPSPAWRYGLAWALYLCALFAKTITASVPAVLLVIDWWKRGRIGWRDVAWLSPFFATGVALSSVTVWMERVHVGASGAEWSFSLLERVLIAGRAVWFYAGKLAWPHPLIFFYPRWEIDSREAWQILFPATALLLIGALWLPRHRIGRGPLAACLIFVGVLTPALGFFDVYPFRYSFVADHFQYHASIALIACAVAGATVAIARLGLRARVSGGVVAVAVVIALSAVTRRQVLDYRDLPTLYASVIEENPGSWAAHNNLGRFLQNTARLEDAIVQYRAALELAPQHARIRNNLGSTLERLGRVDEAAAELERALVSEGDLSDRADTRIQLAVVRIRQGRFDEAGDLLRTALQLRPRDSLALYNLGVALGGGGDLEAGAAAVRDSLAIEPGFATGHHELGALRRAAGDVRGAIAAFSEAVRLEPDDPAFRTSLALALLQAGELERAEGELRSALASDPEHVDAANTLGIVLGTRGDFDGARAAFETVLRIDPSHADASENLRRLRAAASPAH